ncbi:lipoprotein [Kangiella sp. HZ709]|nr:lipoprotein [Kangiella sp. HZ709]MRX28030.1 hypothetical protein [Kangiella sp. HZ709]
MKKIQRLGSGIIIACFVTTILAACGQKGPLRQPEPAPQAVTERR